MLIHPAMKRRMRTLMSGVVGRAGENPALTRLCVLIIFILNVPYKSSSELKQLNCQLTADAKNTKMP